MVIKNIKYAILASCLIWIVTYLYSNFHTIKMNYVVTCYAVSRVFKREEEWGSQQG